MSTGATNREPQDSAPTEAGLGPDDVGRIMERLGEGAILVDLATRAVLKANDQFYKLSRFEPADLPDLELVRLHDLGDLERILQKARQPEESGQVMPGMTISGRDGALFAADVRVTSFAHGESALVLLTYHAPAPEEGTGRESETAAPAPSTVPVSLPTFTRQLASVRERDDLCRVLVEASAALMGSEQVLLVTQRGTQPGTETIASYGLPAPAQDAATSWLGQMVTSGLLSPERTRVIEALVIFFS